MAQNLVVGPAGPVGVLTMPPSPNEGSREPSGHVTRHHEVAVEEEGRRCGGCRQSGSLHVRLNDQALHVVVTVARPGVQARRCRHDRTIGRADRLAGSGTARCQYPPGTAADVCIPGRKDCGHAGRSRLRTPRPSWRPGATGVMTMPGRLPCGLNERSSVPSGR